MDISSQVSIVVAHDGFKSKSRLRLWGASVIGEENYRQIAVETTVAKLWSYAIRFVVLEERRIEDFMMEGQADSRTSSILCFFHFSYACSSVFGNVCVLAVVSRVNAHILTWLLIIFTLKRWNIISFSPFSWFLIFKKLFILRDS